MLYMAVPLWQQWTSKGSSVEGRHAADEAMANTCPASERAVKYWWPVHVSLAWLPYS